MGAAVVFIIFQSLLKKKEQEASDTAVLLTRAARKATSEASFLEKKVKKLELERQEGSDLILLFPDLVKRIFSARDGDEVVEFVNRSCQSLLKADETAVFLADRTGARLCLSASNGLEDVVEERTNLGLGDGFVGLAAETGRLLFRGDLEKESVLVRRKLIMSDIPAFKPDYAAPMQVEGVLYGVITAGAFRGADTMREETLRALAAVGAAALENVRVLERFGKSTSLDAETGFCKNSALEPTLENELERVERFGSALAAIELVVNSTEVEDNPNIREIMTVAAKHIHASLRNIDVGVRTGSDSLILLLPGTDAEGLQSVTGKLGGELPKLKLDSGEFLGAVSIKGYVVEGGSRLDARDMLNRLRSQEIMEFDGYYE